MSEGENPYRPPMGALELEPSDRRGSVWFFVKVSLAVVTRVVFRFFGALATTFLVLIDFLGLGVNWSNAGLLIGFFCIGCLGSHFVLRLRSASVWLDFLTGWPLYLLGATTAVVIVISNKYPRGF